MAVSLSDSPTWGEIELSESYLVSSMFMEASSLASSVLKRLRKTSPTSSTEDVQLEDMRESGGMVLVQSLKELGRTSEIMNELRHMFDLMAAVPVQVLVTGACFQISEGCTSGLREIFEEFLCKWKYVDRQSYVLENLGPHNAASEGWFGCATLGIDKYLEVAELYAVTLLGTVLGETDPAISWVETAELPEEKRQEMLRRLQSLYSSCVLGPSQSSERDSNNAFYGTNSATSLMEEFSSALEPKQQPNRLVTESAMTKSKHPSLGRLSETMDPCFWWFRTVTLRLGNARLVLSHGRIVIWGSFFLFVYYIFRRKGITFKQIAYRKATSVKKALIDAWQLAFSVQVNPLAAVQPIPGGTRGSR